MMAASPFLNAKFPENLSESTDQGILGLLPSFEKQIIINPKDLFPPSS